HRPEVDAELFVTTAGRHREISGDADQQLVKNQSLRPEDHQLLQLQPCEVPELVGVLDAGRNVLGTENGRQGQELSRNLRPQPRIPWSKTILVAHARDLSSAIATGRCEAITHEPR